VEEVDLPVVSGETSIEAALEVMRTSMRSGLVTARGDRYVVLTDEDLIDAFREHGRREVTQVEPAHRTLVISPNLPRYREMLQRMGEFAAVDEFLRANYGHFALTPPDRVRGDGSHEQRFVRHHPQTAARGLYVHR
jgi:CBS domain-containing protein